MDKREKLKRKLNKLPLNYYDTRETGDVLSVFVNDVDSIQQSLQQVRTKTIITKLNNLFA